MRIDTKKENDQLEIKRHSLAHIMAAAVKELRPDVKFAIGPAIENGFYYDFDFGDEKITDDDLKMIEKKMNHILKQNLKFEKTVVDIDDAMLKEKKAGQVYKSELLADLKIAGQDGLVKNEISYYQTGGFEDMCRGPHIESTKEISKGSFKIVKIAGAYWKGDEKNKMLTRIYGYAFDTKEELDDYIKKMEEAEKSNHKKIGKELDLFSFHPEAPGAVFWHEKGMILWNELEKFGKSIRLKYGYIEIKTPQMAKNDLWITSGHWDHYKDDMFVFGVENDTYCLKPMDCPFNIKIYQTKQRSYKDLPIRYTEIGRVFRNEKSGELNGLFRVREITQDDSHVFLLESQIENEISKLIEMVEEYYGVLGLKPQYFLSTRPEDFIGEIATWDKAEKALINSLSTKNIKYGLKDKDGAFYGPKIDVNVEDVFGRSWQVATIQLDFQLCERFGCEYVDANDGRKTPVLIHAAVFGSFERMIGTLIEHFKGSFPVWLSPVQVRLISVGEGHREHCLNLMEEFKDFGVRVETDNNDETVGNKIRKATMEKIPYVLVIGDKEVETSILSVRERGSREAREVKKDEFLSEIKNVINIKK